jgi:hypothetical protein
MYALGLEFSLFHILFEKIIYDKIRKDQSETKSSAE